MIKGPPPAYLDSHPLTFFINMGSKRLTSCGLYAILFPVMRDMNITCEEVFESNTEVVSCACCGCGEQHHIDRSEADEWHNLENFMCWECE